MRLRPAYAESRERFEEFLHVMRLAFTQERFSYARKISRLSVMSV